MVFGREDIGESFKFLVDEGTDGFGFYGCPLLGDLSQGFRGLSTLLEVHSCRWGSLPAGAAVELLCIESSGVEDVRATYGRALGSSWIRPG
mmetsp:Transcript_20669/g.83888  ORF Transcript_20669/g.83888 Transcript_20669/m.83888 type:complete len:91 (+) Transcript_20669:20-292(+)